MPSPKQTRTLALCALAVCCSLLSSLIYPASRRFAAALALFAARSSRAGVISINSLVESAEALSNSLQEKKSFD
jgi:hypothetical protein